MMSTCVIRDYVLHVCIGLWRHLVLMGLVFVEELDNRLVREFVGEEVW